MTIGTNAMKTSFSLSVVTLLCSSGSLQASTRDSIETQIEWKLTLDVNGGITELVPIDANYLPAVRQQLEPVIRSWHFTPGKLNGRPAPTETTLRVGVALDATHAGLYHGRITFADTGPTYGHMVQPEYPETAQHFRHEGGVMLLVEYDTEGRVTSVRHVPEMGTAKVDGALRDAAIQAVMRWTYRAETVAGQGVAGRALAPICFTLSHRPCHWNRPKGGKPVESGRPIALASVVGLDMGSTK